MDDTHAVLNAVFHPERHPHRGARTQGSARCPDSGTCRRRPRHGARRARRPPAGYGALPSFPRHPAQYGQGCRHRPFPLRFPRHIAGAPRSATRHAPRAGRQPASFCGRRRIEGFTGIQQVEHMQGRFAFRDKTFPAHNAGCNGVVFKLSGPIRRDSRSKLRIGIPCQPSIPATGRRFAGQTRLLERDAPLGKEVPHRPQPRLIVTGGTGVMDAQRGDAAATGLPHGRTGRGIPYQALPKATPRTFQARLHAASCSMRRKRRSREDARAIPMWT